jgi:hypothetical protein
MKQDVIGAEGSKIHSAHSPTRRDTFNLIVVAHHEMSGGYLTPNLATAPGLRAVSRGRCFTGESILATQGPIPNVD